MNNRLQFNDRQRQIIFFILQKEFATAEFISEIFNVSSKTIRNDIREINSISRVKFISSSNNGFNINKKYIELIDSITLHNNKLKDVHEITYYILLNGKITTKEITEKLYISKTKTIKRIDELDLLLLKNSLKLIKNKLEYFIDGSESHKRRFYIKLFLEKYGNYSFENEELKDFFLEIDVDLIIKTIENCFDKYNVNVNTLYKRSIILNLLCTFNFNLGSSEFKIESYHKKTKLIAEEINQKIMGINKSKIDIIYMSLIGITNENYDEFDNFKEKIIVLTESSFNKFRLKIDVSKFVENYYKHIYDMIIRCKHKNLIHINDSIVVGETNMFIYDVATDLANNINKKFDIKIDSDEIYLISMHIGFAIEDYLSRQSIKENINVFVDIGEYHYTPNYISKVTSLFESDINITYKFNEDVDLIVTTKKQTKYTLYKTVKISPFFSIDDKNKIQKYINDIKFKKRNKIAKNIFSILLNENLFYINENINTSKEAILFLTKKLREINNIDQKILTSVFIREEMSPTCINNRYAIPHNMDFTENKSSIIVLINKNGIQWNNQNVKIVFLSIINKHDVANVSFVYSYINEFISEDINYLQLIKSKDFDEFYNILFNR
ncbi:MAG: PTS sugar transporter subunit IIA [Mycoplasmatales bacterium]